MIRLFFFNDTATTEIYTLSLHDALPILDHTASLGRPLFSTRIRNNRGRGKKNGGKIRVPLLFYVIDRKSTRLNSSHANISYAVFCLKKKGLMLRSKKVGQRGTPDAPIAQ